MESCSEARVLESGASPKLCAGRRGTCQTVPLTSEAIRVSESPIFDFLIRGKEKSVAAACLHAGAGCTEPRSNDGDT